jgi:hypothetical protein
LKNSNALKNSRFGGGPTLNTNSNILKNSRFGGGPTLNTNSSILKNSRFGGGSTLNINTNSNILKNSRFGGGPTLPSLPGGGMMAGGLKDVKEPKGGASSKKSFFGAHARSMFS